MAKMLRSRDLAMSGKTASHYDEALWIYNGLDNTITYEVWERLRHLDGGFAYDMSRMMQGPALTLMRRGVRIDPVIRIRLRSHYINSITRYRRFWTMLCTGIFGEDINPGSPQQLQRLFYHHLRIPEIKVYDRASRESRVTTNRDALEQLSQIRSARIFTTLLFEIRELEKKLQVLRSGVDADGRMRCSYHVAGTETGRWSSSKSAFGDRGSNLQNITDEMRQLFIPDPGLKFCQIDLTQAESVIVGFVTQDENYLAALSSGDLHVYVAKLCWPHLPWNEYANPREVADRLFYRHFTYRDLSKRGGHGSNYAGTPGVIASNLKIERRVAEDFQSAYYRAFPGIPRWHSRVKQKLVHTRTIETAWGRKAQFPGRPTDSSVIKAAIAYEPQSSVGDYLNFGLYNLWRDYDKVAVRWVIELLLQVHDAVVFQYDPADEEWLIPAAQSAMRFPLTINGRECVIESEAMVGWNWAKASSSNPYGLVKYKGRDNRMAPPQPNILSLKASEVL